MLSPSLYPQVFARLRAISLLAPFFSLSWTDKEPGTAYLSNKERQNACAKHNEATFNFIQHVQLQLFYLSS